MQAKLIPAFLSLVACVPVANPDPNDDTEFEAVDTEVRPANRIPPNTLPVTIEPAQPSMSPNSLFAMSLANHAPVSELIGVTAAPRDVIEQRIVTTKDEAIELVIDLTPPTGDFARTIVSDTLNGVQTGLHVTCVSNGNPVLGNGGKCNLQPPQPRSASTTGAIETSKWQLAVVDELTRTPVSTCVAEENRIACTLPARAGIAYRVVASANGFSNLWDNSAGLGEQSLAGGSFTGTVRVGSDFHCISPFFANAESIGCDAAIVFTRYFALDRATLAFDPIELTIGVNGFESTWQSASLLWESGDGDAPGANF